ncbi:protein FAR1-RELATED SEQUENCE 9 [Lycium ferocissimum]|uniref:protein FAR1-RELATED SEQUENCE 9 n=1 Tax=Lycium ferocissimum TaxID=112874 RepID=UPI0028162003|nr:protein FAR1-RELATED SEQUENCE 9 [Lycium ferocissimum]
MNSRQRILGGGVQHVLDYLRRMQAESPGFFYAVQDDNGCSNGNIFWADASARMNYHYFGDSINFDTCYRANCYSVPFATFTGLNHHAQPVLFGCALLFNGSETSLVWLLQTWLQAMSGQKPPVSITTDTDHLIQMAVTHVLPETRHRLCKWSILRETKEKLTHVCQTHPTFEIEFIKCINEAETIEEFESQWKALLQRYYLLDNDYLQSIYSASRHWVPVFMRDTFFGDFLSDDDEDKNSFFNGFVDASTSIQLLIKHYEKALTIWHEKELKADFDSTNTTPVLKTPSPMEKQAANLYTRKVFMKFQEELVETLANPATKIDDSGAITTYHVAKFGEEHKAHTVRFNTFELTANCSCLMFEFSGIICRHVLSVFRAKNVLTLPSQYILKRWTRNAKTGGGSTIEEHRLELPSNSQESLTIRHNSLRQEAIKFVEEGAKSIHSYNVAVNALKEAAKKVAAAKKKNADKTLVNNMVNGRNQGVDEGDIDQADSGQSKEEKEQKIRELTAELDCINQQSEVYRSNLLAVLKDMEEQKLKLSVKVQNARLSLKE